MHGLLNPVVAFWGAPDLGGPLPWGDPSGFWLVLESLLTLSTSLFLALTNRDLLVSAPILLARF